MTPLSVRKRETSSFLRSPSLFLSKELTVKIYLLFRPDMALQHKLQCTEEQSQKMANKVSFWRMVPFEDFTTRGKKKMKNGSNKILQSQCSQCWGQRVLCLTETSSLRSADTIRIALYFLYHRYNRNLFFSEDLAPFAIWTSEETWKISQKKNIPGSSWGFPLGWAGVNTRLLLVPLLYSMAK